MYAWVFVCVAAVTGCSAGLRLTKKLKAVYICMHVCMYVLYVYVCMQVCMYECTYIYVCMHVWMYVCIHICMVACVHVCLYVCKYTRMYLCVWAATESESAWEQAYVIKTTTSSSRAVTTAMEKHLWFRAHLLLALTVRLCTKTVFYTRTLPSHDIYTCTYVCACILIHTHTHICIYRHV